LPPAESTTLVGADPPAGTRIGNQSSSFQPMSIQTARVDWERAFAELETQTRDPRRYARLLDAVDAVTAGLRARVGQTFTMEQLLTAYGDVERWGREAVADRAPFEGWPRDLALVQDAAFHLYARGAIDFEP
jgi:hypothetical protein